MRIIVVTGLSGGGKSVALRALEDLSFYCVDNLPLPLIRSLVSLMAGRGLRDLALCVDARQYWFLPLYRDAVNELRANGHQVEVLFFEASHDVLVRRYSETRRRHPLSGDEIADGIYRDKEQLSELRGDAAVIDTGNLTQHDLRRLLHDRYGATHEGMSVSFQSFGYKYGLPPEADLVFDVRFLPNPFFVAELKEKTGQNPEVSSYVLASEQGGEFLKTWEQFLRFCLPNFAREGKMYLTIAVGCTGGKHRSVALVEEMGRRLENEWDVSIRHRDMGRDTATALEAVRKTKPRPISTGDGNG